MTDILMPKLSDTMTEGILGVWLKNAGDQIVKGDIIAEVETDKATMELEAFVSGTLLEQRVTAGQTVAVGTVIGIIGEQTGMTAAEKPAATDTSATVAAPQDKEIEDKSAPLAEPEAENAPQPVSGGQAGERAATHRAEASAPVVRRRAHEMGVELDKVQGSGPGGRVLLEDLEQYAQKTVADASTPLLAKPAQPDKDEVSSGRAAPAPTGNIQPLARMRAAIARTVSESWQNIPHFSITSKIRMDKAEEIHRELKNNNISISINDIIIKATALSLQKFMLLNSSYSEKGINLHQQINIGIMASIAGGIFVPVIKGCQSLSLKEIADKSRKLLEQARSGAISQSDMDNGTFSISNLGMFGINSFNAIILPAQAALIAVGAIRDEIIADRGQPILARMMEVTLSADHRVVDGAYAAEFLVELKSALETPIQLLL